MGQVGLLMLNDQYAIAHNAVSPTCTHTVSPGPRAGSGWAATSDDV